MSEEPKKPVILCVDDETIILDSLEMQLERHLGEVYQYEFAENAEEALELLEELREEGHHVALVLSDWLMPEIKGDEFLAQVHGKYPEVVKIMLTGQADDQAVKRAEAEADLFTCLPKPWKAEDLIGAIRRGLEAERG